MEFITLIVILVFLQDSVVSFVIEKYVHEGKEVNLTCPMKIAIANLTWRGPPELKLYATRTTASNIQNIQVIHVGKENILKILKFNAKNEGLYQCTSLYGGEDTFKVTILRTPNVSIVDEFYTRDETLNLSCIASGGVPDNYTYEWEHRTNADHHIRFLTTTPFITVRNTLIQSNGAYVCRVFNAYGFDSSKQTATQFAVYNLSIPAVPHFVFNNTKELYIHLNQTAELKVHFVANPAANTILLMDNKPALEFNSTDITKSVQNATVLDYYYDKAVIVNGYEIKLWICIRDTLAFSNITIVLQNDRGTRNCTIQLKTAKHNVQYKRNVGSKHLLASLLTLSIIGVMVAVVGLKFVCGKCMTQSCKDNSTVQLDENDYDASTPQRLNDVQGAFANDVYGDVNQNEVTTHNGQVISTQRTVFQNQSRTTDGISRIKELNYIEVNFNQKLNQRKHVIIRNDRTQYADVDLSIKTDPLPETDSENDEDSTS